MGRPSEEQKRRGSGPSTARRREPLERRIAGSLEMLANSASICRSSLTAWA
jgi:hypothetical protein